jgi:biofilm protein TabA
MKTLFVCLLFTGPLAMGQTLGPIKNIRPHASINKKEYARQFQAHPDRWQKALDYLANTRFDTVQPGRYELDGDNVYVLVTQGPLRNKDSAFFEAHKRYADIHYVADGEESIGVAPFTGTQEVKPYDAVKDIAFYREKGKFYTATPAAFFVFFAGLDAHMPGLQVNGHNSNKKIVIKIKTADL